MALSRFTSVLPLLFFPPNSRARVFPSLPFLLPFDRATPVQRGAARCTYAIQRHVSAIFCAADESCRDRPMNASNIPAHRVSPSRGVFPERDTFWPGALLTGSGSLSFNRVNTVPFSYSREPSACASMTKHYS